MSSRGHSIALALTFVVGLCLACDSDRGVPVGPFRVEPYLQLGQTPDPTALALLWHADDRDDDWSVAYRTGPDAAWQSAKVTTARRVAVEGESPFRVYRAALTDLPRGQTFEYRVSLGGEVVFQADGRTARPAGEPSRFVAFGDCGADTAGQRAVAFRAYQEHPDLVVITGDVVYARGRLSEYRERFWPIYNAGTASPDLGAPLLRSTPFVAAAGNHDVAARDLDQFPDGLAYFLVWDQPLNGPDGAEGPHVGNLEGSASQRKAFLDAAGETYPRMANFSFDHGDAHWTVIDSNPYVDWTDAGLREWLTRDLAAAQQATWRFVTFHHPGFNSSHAYSDQQHMRQLAPVLEAGKVDVVFSGHVHNYQRSFPLRFEPANPSNRGPKVDGRWTLDKNYDGRTRTHPDGVIYIVTGAGGSHLYNPEQEDDRASWQTFTHTFRSRDFSLTVADVQGATLTVRQIQPDGEEIDRFVIKK